MKRLAVLALPLTLLACGSSDDGTTADGGGMDGGVTDGGVADAAVDVPVAPFADGGAITGTPPDTWTWVDFPEAKCRDGSPTGIGVNVHPGATKLMVFLEGGGACFNAATCAANPASYARLDLAGFAGTEGVAGIFSRLDPANPVKDWSFVYVPYCTGDVHGGDNPVAQPPGVSQAQQFVGYTNIHKYLERIVPTFPGMTQVLLTGQSAGGFGAAVNYTQVARAFDPVPVVLIDDSGPPMNQPYIARCLQDAWKSLFGLDKTIVPDCGADCPDPTNFLVDYAKHIAKTYPNATMGLMDSTGDGVIASFFGFGASNCAASVPLSAQTYQAGLDDLRSQLAFDKNFASFYFPGIDHTSLVLGYDLRYAGGVKLTDWIAQLLAGNAQNAGP